MPTQHEATTWHKTDIRLATVVAAFASVGAGVIHTVAVPQHWQDWIPSGLFFVGIAFFQFAWATMIVRFPRTDLLSAGIAANLGSMALWGASRTWGVPVGPSAGVPEAVGIPGVLATLFEAIVVLSAAWSLLPRERAAVFAPGAYRFALGGAAVFVTALTPLGVVAGLEHAHGSAGHTDGGSHHEREVGQTPGSDEPSTTAVPESKPGGRTPASAKPTAESDEHDAPAHSHGS